MRSGAVAPRYSSNRTTTPWAKLRRKIPPAGVELATSSLGRNRSIQLSYGGANQCFLETLEDFFEEIFFAAVLDFFCITALRAVLEVDFFLAENVSFFLLNSSA